MDYKYLAAEELLKFVEQENETEDPMTFGDILYTITREKYVGEKITNRKDYRNISDTEWYNIINKAKRDEQ